MHVRKMDKQSKNALKRAKKSANKFLREIHEPLHDMAGTIYIGEYMAVDAILSEHDDKEQALPEIGSNAMGYADSQINRLMADDIPCKEGCHYCCYQDVHITKAEVVLITLVVDQISDKVKQNLLNDKSDYVSLNGSAPMPYSLCPLLEDGKCMIYDYRPVFCRSYCSLSLETCKASHESEIAGGDAIPVSLDAGINAIGQTISSAIHKRLGGNDHLYLRDVLRDHFGIPQPDKTPVGKIPSMLKP